MVESLFRLTGWKFADKGDKARDFARQFSALGISIVLFEFCTGSVSFDNTSSRKADIVSSLDQIVADRKLDRMSALKLRGRLQFAAGQVFGRVAKKSLAVVTSHAYSSVDHNLSEIAAQALCLQRDLLTCGLPREVTSGHSFPCWFVFTDASFEPQDGNPYSGIGAVLVDSNGKYQEFFALELSQSVLQRMNPKGEKTNIFECEFFALYLALRVWFDKLKSSHIVFFTDNEAVKDCMVTCSTTNAIARDTLNASLHLEFHLSLIPWHARAPTEANVADNPSRGVCEPLLDIGAVQVWVDSDKIFAEMLSSTGAGWSSRQPHAEQKDVRGQSQQT